MLIDVVRPETWDELNDQVHSLLGLQPKEQARCYKGLGAATYEIARGTSQFMTHKRSVGFILGQTPVFESLLPSYYKDTFDITATSHVALTDINEWVEGLKKDTSFVFYSEDHPVTGELYPFVDELDQLLNAKRIFSFRISHHKHHYDKAVLRPYSVRLCSYTSEVAIAICGERFRAPALVAREESWILNEVVAKIKASEKTQPLDSSLIQQFEKSVHPWGQAFFSSTTLRLFDRAIVVFADVSAEAVAQYFFKMYGGEKWKLLETPNMCRWSTMGLFHKWWQPAVSLETLRGMLIIDPVLLSNKDFANQLHSAYEEVKLQQSWDV